MPHNWFDEAFSNISESTARQVSRRGMVRRVLDLAFKGSIVAVLGLTSARKAWAHHCGCSFPGVTCPVFFGPPEA